MFDTLQAGIAKSKITPPVGVAQSGYAFRLSDSAGVHDDLMCKAVVFANEETKAVLVSLDLLGLTFEQVARIRAAVSDWMDIPGPNVWVACSHTHAGPAVQRLRFCGTPDEDYVSWMLDTVVETIEKAKLDLAPCRILKGSTSSDLAINRRHFTPAGTVVIGENTEAFCDRRLPFFHVVRDEKPGAIFYNYACHGVVLGGDNVQISADWIGAASRFIEQNTGETALFLQGCCGSANPRLHGSFDAVDTAGAMVGKAVVGTLRNASEPDSNDSSAISVTSMWLDLPFLPLPPREELQKMNAEMKQQIAAERAEGKPEYMLNTLKASEEWSRDALAALEADSVQASQPIELSVMQIGGIRLFAIPGEVFGEFAENIRAFAPDAFVVGYVNGNIGYIPTAAAYDEGGYEVEHAYVYYGLQMIGPESEGMIMAAAREMLGKAVTSDQ